MMRRAVALDIDTRLVGNISVVTCHGRLGAGSESEALAQRLDALLADHPQIILNLSDVPFIDSSGLGLLVRYHARARQARGGLKLCAVSAIVSEVLRITKLDSALDCYEAEAEAVVAFHRLGKAPGPDQSRANILVVNTSAHVQAYIRELLRQAGYGVTTADNLSDALTLLRAMKPKGVILSADVRGAASSDTWDTLRRLTSGVSIIELPADFSTHEAGEAGSQLLDRIATIIDARR